MNNPGFSYLPKYFTSKASWVYFVVLLFCSLSFFNILPLIWSFFGIIEVVFFFSFSNHLTCKWAEVPEKYFQKQLFKYSFIIRVTYIILIYLFYLGMTGKPFEFDAADSEGYHKEGIWIADLLKSGYISFYFNEYNRAVSDKGFPLALSAIYFVFNNSILIARILLALLSAKTVLLIYRLAFRTFGIKSARITAVMAMLMPTFIYYSGLHTKETLMVFLLIFFVERTDFMLRSPTIRLVVVLQVVFIGASLFMLRTVLAAAAWFALFSALILSANRVVGRRRKIIYILWFAVAGLFLFSGTIYNEMQTYTGASAANLDSQMRNFSNRFEGNKFAKYGSTSIFLPMMLIAPFPTMVNVEDQDNAMMINGNVFVHNIYAYFVIYALFLIIKRKLVGNSVLILTLLGSYLFILASSGFALSERFHVPIVPFLLILAGYGINQMNKRFTALYIPYLILISAIILGWNWFKLAGRGII